MLTSLYVHVPFCEHICTYCDFHKSLATNEKKEAYIDALCKELQHHKKDFATIKTIYIGGGTPMALPYRLLDNLLTTIQEVVNLEIVDEYTIETNPNNLTEKKIDLLIARGITRVSVGVQTFNPIHLQRLGRDHTPKDIAQGVLLLRHKKMPKISIDMMFSLVQQTMDELKEDVNKLLDISPDHISYYSLIWEEKTTLYHWYMQGKVTMNDEDTEADMFHYIIDELTKNGYHQYEISNFAKTQSESQHNNAYWFNHEYLGVGSGAHSHYNGTRWFHKPHVTDYITRMNTNDFEPTDRVEVDELADCLLLGLRRTKGIHIPTIESQFAIDLLQTYPIIQEHIKNQLLAIEEDYLHLTKRGILLGNIVFESFVEVR